MVSIRIQFQCITIFILQGRPEHGPLHGTVFILCPMFMVLEDILNEVPQKILIKKN